MSVDLIYGTPGETPADWEASVRAALAAGPDHVSAYALALEPATRMAAQIRRGTLPEIDLDAQADCYELADALLGEAGMTAYEISNWALPGYECRHNLGYWRGDTWWGFGPGAHSHAGGVRWWNVKHPATYAGRLAAGESPAAEREVLTAEERREERVLLEIRISDGLPVAVLTASERRRVPTLVRRGLVVAEGDRLRLTLRGRLLADAVVRDLLD